MSSVFVAPIPEHVLCPGMRGYLLGQESVARMLSEKVSKQEHVTDELADIAQHTIESAIQMGTEFEDKLDELRGEMEDMLNALEQRIRDIEDMKEERSD